MKHVMLAAVSLLALAGCTTGENVRMQLQTGMTRAQVEGALGRPDGYRRDENRERLTYSSRLVSGWSWNSTDYVVEIENDRVVGWRTGPVQDNDTPVRQALVPAMALSGAAMMQAARPAPVYAAPPPPQQQVLDCYRTGPGTARCQ